MESDSHPNLLDLKPIQYRNWLISTKIIHGKLWLRWQHPDEDFPRYGYPIGDKGLGETIGYVRLLIDTAIQLEESASPTPM